MAERERRESSAGAVLAGGLSAVGGGIIATLMAGRPAEGAEPDARWDYLIQCQEAIIALLEQNLATQEQILTVQKEIKEIKVTIASWEAREPVVLFDRAITMAATINADRMINWSTGKRLLIKVESLLDQDCIIQVVGNITDNYLLATDINGPLPCLAQSNISIGLAWDDWHPFIGVRITTGVAPTSGILTISAVAQE